jgi:prepilin-type N-terminal cleavage/methylation domain-containing protein/prepilin-type processing-associated H-X9-DG protein
MTNNRSPAFTIIEMIIVLAVIAIMMSFVYPMYTGATERAKATKDLSNLHQIGIAMQTYLNDSDQVLPASGAWPGTSPTPSPTPGLYQKYIATRKVFQSPFDKRTPSEANDAPVSYGINTTMYVKLGANPNMLKVVSPTSTFLMAPNYTGDPANASSWAGTATSAPDLAVGAPAETKGTHSSGRQINVLFCDWHTESLTFGPAGTAGTFQDWQSIPLGVKHWDPTQ